MEMLIVVAIIAILVAIAIPTLNSSLERAKLGADEASIRTAVALAGIAQNLGEITIDGVQWSITGPITAILNKDGTLSGGLSIKEENVYRLQASEENCDQLPAMANTTNLLPYGTHVKGNLLVVTTYYDSSTVGADPPLVRSLPYDVLFP